MDSAGYIALGRQSGLMREMQTIANNIANISTNGFRREGVVFSEYVKALPQEPSLSMAQADARWTSLAQAGLTQTGGAFDLAIEGAGFFLVMTPAGERLTRAGSFSPSAEGELVTPEGYPLLDQAGGAIFAPPDAKIAIGVDGTMSANGVAIAQIGLWQSADPLALHHSAGTLFETAVVEPAATGRIRQGFLEESNVNPILEISRMITVQRAYEMGQNFLEAEDGRTRKVIETLGK